jgi:hypothetical protein
MPIIRLILRDAAAKPKATAALFAGAKLERPYFPIRGLPPSLVIHIIAFTVFNYFASFPGVLPNRSIPEEKIVMIDLNDPTSVMLLPMLEGGNQGKRPLDKGAAAKPAAPPEAAPKAAEVPKPKAAPAVASEPGPKAPEPPSTTTKGFSYPGPQPIISDVEAPTNRFQTLLQPDIQNLPILPPPVMIPNVVQIADLIKVPQLGEPPPPTEPEETESAPKPPEPKPQPVEPPKPEPKPPEPPPKPVEPPKPAPKPIEPPKAEPKPPEPIPKPVEPPKPEPTVVVPPEPIPKPAEPAPEPVEPPKPAPKPIEPPKPEPKPPEPAPKPAQVTKSVTAQRPASKQEQKQPRPEAKPAEQGTGQQLPAVQKPVSAAPAAAKSTVSKPPSGQKATAPPDETETVNSSDLAASLRNILSLSPMPAPPNPLINLPLGEARGRFAIAPQPDLTGSDAEPGFKTGTPSPKIGIGNSEGAPARKGIAPTTTPVASAKAGSVGGSGTGKPNPGGAASGSGRTAGTGSGTSPDAGNGSGSTAGNKPFAGITIVGGDYEPGSDSEEPTVKRAVKPLQTAYGINIISTEDSGGGLPYFGVFSHEQIYTVYLDMRTVETDPDPFWTLEFALMQDDSPPSAVIDLNRKQQGFILPFPSVKEKPAWPVDLVQKYPGKMVIVYGVINTEGKMEQISIKDSPDPLLNEPLIKALEKWIFRPAQAEGRPVQAKALFGIPLRAPE